MSQDAGAPVEDLLISERERTSARVAGLTRDLEAIVESSALEPGDDEHDPEGSTIGFERAQVASLLNEARNHLAALDRARERLRTGTYGFCEICGQEIDPERLAARPTATTCMACGTGTASGLRRV